jgi:hypothetical protein
MTRHYHEWATKAGMEVAGSGSKVKEGQSTPRSRLKTGQGAGLWRPGVGGLDLGPSAA